MVRDACHDKGPLDLLHFCIRRVQKPTGVLESEPLLELERQATSRKAQDTNGKSVRKNGQKQLFVVHLAVFFSFFFRETSHLMWGELVDRVLQHSEIPRQPLFSRQTELPRNLIDTETGKLSRVIADLVATQVGQNVVSATGLLAQQPTTSTSLTKIGHVVLESAGVSPSRLQTITWEILASASATVPTVPDALPVPVVSEPLSHPVSEPVSPYPCMPLPYN